MLVITGPNMGGKSTYMRQVALIALLALSAASCRRPRRAIGPIDRIFTRIGAADDLAGGRSTFMVEMTEAADILNAHDAQPRADGRDRPRHLAPSTASRSPGRIARHLAERNRAFTLFATHYFELWV